MYLLDYIKRWMQGGEQVVQADRLALLLRDLADAGPGSAVVAMSPHLDDAVMSCGALLAHLAGQHPVTVASVFTAAAPRPWSLPARKQLRALGGVDAEDFWAQRRAEDTEVLAGLGAAAVHLGFRDALFRRGRRGPAYPAFRFDAARGRVAACDAGLAAEVSTQVSARVGAISRAGECGVIFAPLGIGRHVDHLITRRAAGELGRQIRIVYYSDFPYSQSAAPDPHFVRSAGLVPHPWFPGRAENASRIAGYRTQFPGLFGDGTVPTCPEIYWIAAKDSATAA
jgi:LmbE family N-acetylglucosaminyl deacetylase